MQSAHGGAYCIVYTFINTHIYLHQYINRNMKYELLRMQLRKEIRFLKKDKFKGANSIFWFSPFNESQDLDSFSMLPKQKVL